VNACNCSICTKNGYLLVYPFRKDFTFEKGQDSLKEYQFATKNVWHQFCGECGSSCFIRLPENFPLLSEGADPVIVVNVSFLNSDRMSAVILMKCRYVCWMILTTKSWSSIRLMEGRSDQTGINWFWDRKLHSRRISIITLAL
jgi:hypothetical protein